MKALNMVAPSSTPQKGGGGCQGDPIPPIESRNTPRGCVCGPPPSSADAKRGVLPTLIAVCDSDRIVNPGRLPVMWVPRYVCWNFFANGASWAPQAPMQASALYPGSGQTTLTLSLPAPTGPGVISRSRFCGLVISIGTAATTTPGDTTLSVVGTFPDASLYSQIIQLSQGKAGNSRFILLFSQIVSGGAYPTLVQLQTPSADVTDTATNTLEVTVTSGPANAIYTISTLTPVSDYWDWAQAFWEYDQRTQAQGV